MTTVNSELAAGLKAALDALNDEHGRGGAAKLAAALRITQSAVSQWEAIPPKHVLVVEKVTGVERHVLRPDHYPPPPRKRAA